MAKLYFKCDQIQNLILPNLKDSISNIVPAVSTMDSIIIPSSFKYKSELETMKTSLHNIKTSLLSEQEHLISSIFKITNASNELEKVVNIIPIAEIKIRNNKI